MNIRTVTRATAFALPLLALSCKSREPRSASASAATVTLIDDVTVISPERPAPLPHAYVVVRDGRIAYVGTAKPDLEYAHRVSGSGRFLIPGLIDSHVHVDHSAALDDDAITAHPELWAAYRAQVPRAYLAFGYTSVIDLDISPAGQEWFAHTPLHPRFYFCGRGIKVAGGYGAFRTPDAASPDFPNLVFEPAEAKHWPRSLDSTRFTADSAVARVADAGATCVKAFVESGFGIFHWPFLHSATLGKIRAAATRRGLVLAVHATSADSWREAIDAHADVIAHGLWIWPGTLTDSTPTETVRAVITSAARVGVHVQPTLQTVAGEGAMLDSTLLDDPRLAVALPPPVIAQLRSVEGRKSRKQLLEDYRKASPQPGFETLLAAAMARGRSTFRLMLQDSVPLLFGSDTPAGDGFGNPPGLNGRLEMQDWADAGAPLARILRSATLDNAVAFGLSHEIGSIEAGKRADMLLLSRDPLESVDAYDSIELVILNGVAIARDTLGPHQ